MSQQTNLNVSPYFDDFDANNDYYKVLFKPGYPIQSRELTTLQSILQNQIEKFGQHFFKEGAKVIPGNIGYNALYYAIELQNTYQGIPVSAYADQLVGLKITGQSSGVSAVVDKVLMPEDSERGSLTLYVNYLGSNSQDNSTQQFYNGESLICNNIITSGLLGNSTIPAGSSFAITKAENSSSTGSSFSITNGVYFVRGQFVNVKNETLILDQYNNTPSYRVGLFVSEEIYTSDMDEKLTDNSQGFSNYSAPGADRLKISVSLFKKSLDDFNDNNFVELATINNGVLRSQKSTTDNNIISDTLAKRTYAEAGDYYVSPFDVSVKESLNDGIGNRGLFNLGQSTYGGSAPSNDLAIYQVSPGRAFVRGYDVETISPTFLDVPKPRTTNRLSQQSLNYNTGPSLILNRVFGAPTIGIGNTYVLSLRDSRVGSNQSLAAGKEIGVARVYDFKIQSGSYNTLNSNLNQWQISLYDIQTISEITFNVPVTIQVPAILKGKSSGSIAFLKDSVSNSGIITVYNKSGEFITNESFIVDGIDDGKIAIAVTSYGISNIKSVYGYDGSTTFNADTIQSDNLSVGIAIVSQYSSGISTVLSTNSQFPGNNFNPGDLIKYSSSFSDPVYAKVVSIGSSSITLTQVTTVSGITSSILPNSSLSVTDFTTLTTKLDESSDNTLYTKLPKNNISNLDLSTSTLTIRKAFKVNILNNQLSIPVSADLNQTFLPFTNQRYLLIRSDGTTEVLTADKFSYISGGSQLQIYNLGSNNTGATLVATLTKSNPKSKLKVKNRVNSILIDKSSYIGSGIGGTTLNDGLTYGNYPYGTRVQDDIITLNTPDVIQIHGIYEALNSTTSPSAPTALLTSISGPSNTAFDFVIGEQIVGQTSGAVAICAEILTGSTISFIYKNQNIFKEGETLLFKESNISSIVTTLDSPAFDISSNYTFTTGQESTIYNYGTIRRKSTSLEPTKKIKIYFESTYYNSSDDGDITTVNSYNTFDYGNEIQFINGVKNSDIIDIRPRVSIYSVSENSRSPLEFYGRNFNSSGSSAANILASNEDIIASFSYYLGRIDRIYLTKDGSFQVKYGTPSEKLEKPVSVDDALEIANITLPPYLYDVSQASVQFLDHKGYKMSDIKKLEDRIKNLEYYTSLSLLETNTSNLFIPDSNGLNRFKSGFFVDNFTSLLTQENGVPFKNSIDIQNKELRPSHYTTSVDLISGPVINTDPTADLSTSQPDGINIRKSEGVITLDYTEVEWLKQSFSTRTESVTPFLISFWQGTMELTPASDTWVDTVRLDAKIINVEGNYADTLALATKTLNVDPQTGYSPTIWNAWQTNWTGQEIVTSTVQRTETTGATGVAGWLGHSGGRGLVNVYDTVTTSTYEDTVNQLVNTGVSSRTGTRTAVTEQFDQTSAGDKVISRNLISYMRSRNLEFVAKKVKPLTQMYAFFDGVDVTKYCVPKLLEISMISGVFQVGETVIGTSPRIGLNPNLGQDIPSITFRVAQSNHLDGPYNIPSNTYPFNPYTNQTLQAVYSSTSNILNIDIYSLSDQPQGQFKGWIESGMILRGKTSGAQATITNVRLLSDIAANLIGSFYIPDPNINIHPKFETGTKTFTITDSNINDKNKANTIAEEGFISSGTLETVQENIISVRNARIQNKQEIQQVSVSSAAISGTQVVTSSNLVTQSSGQAVIGWYDPLAESFLVEDSTGVFLTRCDVFFATKDDMNIPVTFQLRTMANGYPTQKILPFSEITLDPNQINISSDGSVATSFRFKAPVYLEGGKEYAMCIASNSTKYSVYVCRIGENDLLTKQFISNQPYLGSLFKSQNASTWEASQWEDLKFTLYRAEFLSSGSVEFYNPELSYGNAQIATLIPNPLELNSRKIRIGLASTLQDSGLTIGNTIVQLNSNGSGNYVGNAGIATGTLTTTNSGIGYTPSSGSFTFNNINLTTITGNGRNATANITVSNGSIISLGATIVSGGIGYQVGDVLGISSIGPINVGQNARFTIGSITSINELVLDNVQGEFTTGTGSTIQYINNSGITTILNSSVGGNVIINSPIVTMNDGLHITVNHKNHGMYSNQNYVIISNVQSDIKPTKLSSTYNINDTSTISVDDTSNFNTFEGIGIGTTNPGYVLIGDEIISYTSISGSSLGGFITRGEKSRNYSAGTPVYKYELGGISLNRINTTHNFKNVTNSNPITFDSYQVKIDMSKNGTDRTVGMGTYFPKLYVNTTKSAGGYRINASQNIPFEIVTPMVQNLTVKGTTISSQLRTVTGNSISGNEIPFKDNGFESITINRSNYLNSTRLICSKINEINNLNTVGNKSLNLKLTLDTIDSRISPVIDTQRVNVIFTSNRVNNVISNYTKDNRVNNIIDDPTAFQYISKEISLENAATSIKILANAHINKYCDIRAFYAISASSNFNPIFVPFPGYNNLDTHNQIINFSNNDGSSDMFISPTSSLGFESSSIDFNEYAFTADNLPSFRSYRIKIIMTSTNQVYVPRIKDLRVITLA
jgi:hypothetical protein